MPQLRQIPCTRPVEVWSNLGADYSTSAVLPPMPQNQMMHDHLGQHQEYFQQLSRLCQCRHGHCVNFWVLKLKERQPITKSKITQERIPGNRRWPQVGPRLHHRGKRRRHSPLSQIHFEREPIFKANLKMPSNTH